MSTEMTNITTSITEEEKKSEFKYWVFISYNHQDKKWARWLRKKIERYPIPRRLIGRKTSYGKIPRRLYPVFIDRDEMPSTPNLPTTVKEFLRESRFLLVLCSPNSAVSGWVNEEVKFFKTLGRKNRLLCLVLDGEPYATPHPETATREALPEAIRFKVSSKGEILNENEHPVLAADIRSGRDGKRNAKLKILSGIFEVSFDELKQRERLRLFRRLVLAALPMLMLLVFFMWKQSPLGQIHDIKNELKAFTNKISDPYTLKEISASFAATGDFKNAYLPKATNASALLSIVESAAKMRKWDIAVEAAEKTENDKEKTLAYTSIAQAAVKNGNIEIARESIGKALSAIEKMESISEDLAAIVESATMIGEYETAIKAAVKMYEQESTVKNITQKAASRNELDIILDVVECIDEIRVKVEVLRTIAKAASELGEHNYARKALQKAIRAPEEMVPEVLAPLAISPQNDDENSDISTETNDQNWIWDDEKTLALQDIVFCAKGIGEFEIAIEAADKIEGSNWSKVNSLYVIAEDAAYDGKHLIATRALNKAVEIAENIRDLETRFNALALLARTAILLENLDRALGIIERIQDDYYKNGPLSSIAHFLARKGALEKALVLVESIDSNYHKCSTFSSISQAAANLGEYKVARDALERAEAAAEEIIGDSRISALETIAEAAAQIGEFKRLHKIMTRILVEIEKVEDNASQLEFFALDALKMNLSNLAFAAAERIGNDANKVSVVKAIAQAATTVDELDKTLRLAETIRENAHKYSALEAIAQAAAVRHDFNKALAVAESRRDPKYELGYELKTIDFITNTAAETEKLDEILAAADTITHFDFKLLVLISITNFAAKAGHTVIASQSLDKVLVEPDTVGWVFPNFFIYEESTLPYVLESVAEAATKIGELDKVLALAKSLSFSRSTTLSLIAQVAAKAGEIDKALEVVNLIDRTDHKALQAITKAAAELGEFDTAFVTAEKIGNPELFQLIAVTANQKGRHRLSRESLDKAVAAAEGIFSENQREHIFASITETATSIGELDKALEVAKKIETTDTRYSALLLVARAAAQTGNWRKAREIALLNRTDSHKARTLATILKVWGEGKHTTLSDSTISASKHM